MTEIYRQSPIFSLVTKKDILANFMQLCATEHTPFAKQSKEKGAGQGSRQLSRGFI